MQCLQQVEVPVDIYITAYDVWVATHVTKKIIGLAVRSVHRRENRRPARMQRIMLNMHVAQVMNHAPI